MKKRGRIINHKSTTGRLFLFRIAARVVSTMAPRTAATLAERVFLTPHRVAPPEREGRWVDGARPGRTGTSEGDLATWTWGTGPQNALLIHGWAGRGSQLGAFAAPLVARGFRVIAFDAPGHGESPGKTSSLPQMAAATADVARAVGGVDVVIAHSLGAAAALFALDRLGLECDRLALLAPVARLSSVEKGYRDITGFSQKVVSMMRSRIERRFGFNWSEADPVILGRKQVSPVLVVHDRDDQETSWQGGRDLADACPEGRFVSTDGLGHRRILRDETVIEVIARFAQSPAADAVA